MPAIGLLYDPLFLRHDTGNHPESAERLIAITSHLAAVGLLDRLIPIASQSATPEQLARVHTPEYLAHLARAVPSAGRAYLDPDTVLSPHSLEAASLAAGGVCAAAEQVLRGAVSAAFCAVRPPGHHAESGRGMGFCLYNHVAVAARDLQARHGLRRIAIIDFRRDSPVGPPAAARVAPEAVKAELSSAGLALAREHDFLPHQYFLVFRASGA